MPSIPYDGKDSHTLARALVSFAQGLAPSIPSETFRLPRFRLNVVSDSGDYLALCRRALVDDPDLGPDRALEVAVLDYQTHPEMPRGIWTGEMFGLGLFADGLRPAGLEGALNSDDKLMQFFDPAKSAGIEALTRPGQFPPWIASFPLRNFFHWAYQAIGWRIVHAGTLAVGGRGVMLVGAGGSGKSGTTLSGVLAGLESAGDDYLAMHLDDAGVFAHPVMKLMKQDGAGLRRLGIDAIGAGLGAPNWQNKHEFDFEYLGAGRRVRQIELQAILLPRIARESRSRIHPAPARAAMMNLAPNNLQQLPDGWRQGLAFTSAIARRLPAYYLDLSEDPREIAAAIADFIEGRRP